MKHISFCKEKSPRLNKMVKLREDLILAKTPNGDYIWIGSMMRDLNEI